LNEVSYNPGNMARESLPGNRKLPDYERKRSLGSKDPSGAGKIVKSCYTEGIKAQAGRFPRKENL